MPVDGRKEGKKKRRKKMMKNGREEKYIKNILEITNF